MNVCPTHGTPWKTVPAGVSKRTGQAYGSFQACPVQDCKLKPLPAPAAIQVAIVSPGIQAAAPQYPAVAQDVTSEPVADSVWEKKDRTSIAQTSLKASADINQGTGVSSEDVIAKAEKFYSWILSKRNDDTQEIPF